MLTVSCLAFFSVYYVMRWFFFKFFSDQFMLQNFLFIPVFPDLRTITTDYLVKSKKAMINPTVTTKTSFGFIELTSGSKLIEIIGESISIVWWDIININNRIKLNVHFKMNLFYLFSDSLLMDLVLRLRLDIDVTTETKQVTRTKCKDLKKV